MMQDMDEKIRNMHTGRLVRILNHQLKRESINPWKLRKRMNFTPMQRHVLKHILLETLHRDIYQKNIEEEFNIGRKSTASGILKLMKKTVSYTGRV